MEDSVPFLDTMSEPVLLFAHDTRFGAWASSLWQRQRREESQKEAENAKH